MLQRAQMAKELRQRESFNRPKRSMRANAIDAISISFLVFFSVATVQIKSSIESK